MLRSQFKYCLSKILIVFIIGCAQSVFAVDNNESKRESILNKKVEFILKVANSVTFKNTSNDSYRIAVYGKSKDAKDLYTLIKNGNFKVKNKRVVAYLFKRVSFAKKVDLVYVVENSKLNMTKLTEKVSNSCLIITENYPYDQSLINFTIDKKQNISYSLKEKELLAKGAVINKDISQSSRRIESNAEWQLKLDNAEFIINEQSHKIDDQSVELDTKKSQLKKTGATITDQKSKILEERQHVKENERIISEQRIKLLIITTSSLVILMLLFVLYQINVKRKIAMAENKKKREEILSSITYAQRIQNAFLPSRKVLFSSLNDGFILFNPKNIVSGDFYWVEEENDVVYFAVGDCTGHGVPGALLSVLCSNTLSRALIETKEKKPADILDVSVHLLEEFFSKSDNQMHDGMDIGLCSFNKKTKIVQFAGANRPLYYFKNGKMVEIKGDRQPIGAYDFREPYTNHQFILSKGDTLYLFSDGIVDQFGGPKSKKFMSKKWKSLLYEINHEEMDYQKEIIVEEHSKWQGENETVDDVCVLGIRVT